MRSASVFLVVGMLFAIVPDGRAQGNPGNGRGNPDSQIVPNVLEQVENIFFGEEEEHLIRDWFRLGTNLENLPPGLAKRETLPPGLQRQLVRNGTLPPGLQKRLQPLPTELEAQLPGIWEGMRRVVLGGNVILMDHQTARIVDILLNVF